MKKVLSVAMASAMVLGMGANAFAIEYNTDSKDTAKWPENFKFDGELFVTDKNGNVKKEATTAITTDEEADFAPGDVIWMPLYADDQFVYSTNYTPEKPGSEAVKSIKIDNATNFTQATGDSKSGYYHTDGLWYTAAGSSTQIDMTTWIGGANYVVVDAAGTVVSSSSTPTAPAAGQYTVKKLGSAAHLTVPTTVNVDGVARTVETARVTVDGKTFNGKPADVETKVNNYLLSLKDTNGAYIAKPVVSGTVNVAEIKGEDATATDPTIDTSNGVTTVEYGNYTGNIDKDWSINLKDKTNAVEEIVEKAELHKATKKDVAKYGNENVVINGVYVKVTLKKEWKHVSKETIKYYVYVAENGTENKTNEVWVSGTYANDNVKTVNFNWTNNANTPAVWEAKENGIAVFDYNDLAFFTVKMYEGEKLYLDLEAAYQLAKSNEIYDATGAEVESFYNFITADKNFSRVGELVLVTDDDTLVPYEVDEDGNLVEVEAEYVKGYQIAHTNEKVNGFKFETKELGNYILSEEIVVEEEVEETPEVEEPETETPAPEVPEVEEKPNPNTGAEDFVGLAVSLAVVSVAAAGALALKK